MKIETQIRPEDGEDANFTNWHEMAIHLATSIPRMVRRHLSPKEATAQPICSGVVAKWTGMWHEFQIQLPRFLAADVDGTDFHFFAIRVIRYPRSNYSDSGLRGGHMCGSSEPVVPRWMRDLARCKRDFPRWTRDL